MRIHISEYGHGQAETGTTGADEGQEGVSTPTLTTDSENEDATPWEGQAASAQRKICGEPGHHLGAIATERGPFYQQQGRFVGNVDMNQKPNSAVRIIAIQLQGGGGSKETWELARLTALVAQRWGADMALLTEVGLDATQTDIFRVACDRMGYRAFLHTKTTRVAGVGVIVRKTWTAETIWVNKEGEPRVMAVLVNYQVKGRLAPFLLAPVYGVTGHAREGRVGNDQEVQLVNQHIGAITREARTREVPLVAGGDINSVENPEQDAVGTSAGISENTHASILGQQGLVDTFRYLNPARRVYTYQSPFGIVRLDSIWMTTNSMFWPVAAAVWIEDALPWGHRTTMTDLYAGIKSEVPEKKTDQLQWKPWAKQLGEAVREGGSTRPPDPEQAKRIQDEFESNHPVTEDQAANMITEMEEYESLEELTSRQAERLAEIITAAHRTTAEAIRRTVHYSSSRIIPRAQQERREEVEAHERAKQLAMCWMEAWLQLRILRSLWNRGSEDQVGTRVQKLRDAYETAVARQQTTSHWPTQQSVMRMGQIILGRQLTRATAERDMPSSQPDSEGGESEGEDNPMGRGPGTSRVVRDIRTGLARARRIVAMPRRERRREHLHQGDTGAFSRMLTIGGKSDIAYKPTRLYIDQGWRPPEAAEGVMTAADQEIAWQTNAQAPYTPPVWIKTRTRRDGSIEGRLLHEVEDDSKYRQRLTTWEAKLYTAFLNKDDTEMRRWAAYMDTIDDPFTEDEKQRMANRMWNTAPGLSQVKLHLLRAMGEKRREWVLKALGLAYRHPRAIPSALKIITLVGLPKPNGGFRFVSLMEEWGKLLEPLPVWKMRSIMTEQGSMPVLSPSNRAYRAEANTTEIPWNLQTNSEQARHDDHEVWRLKGDHNRWFDIVKRIILDAKMGAAALSETTRQRMRYMHQNQRICLATTAGITHGADRGESAIAQGGGSCPQHSLFAQDPAQQIIDETLLWDGYQYGSRREDKSEPQHYSDDCVMDIQDKNGVLRLASLKSATDEDLGITNKPSALGITKMGTIQEIDQLQI